MRDASKQQHHTRHLAVRIAAIVFTNMKPTQRAPRHLVRSGSGRIMAPARRAALADRRPAGQELLAPGFNREAERPKEGDRSR